MFKDPALKKKLRVSLSKYRKKFPKQDQTFCRRVRRGDNVIPKTPFENNYILAYKYKYGHKSKEEKMRQLISLAKIELPWSPQPYELRRNRKHRTRKPCQVCGEQAYCQHHIIQLQHGGYDNGINRIPICQECHEIIHPWLRV